MLHSTISVILALLLLAVTTPQASIGMDRSQTEIRRQLDAMPPGTAVDVALVHGQKTTGRIKMVTAERLVLEQGAKTLEFRISDIRSVRTRLLGGSDLEVSPGALCTLVLNEKIKSMTRDGGYIEGKVQQASEETLVIDVSKAEPKGKFRGRTTIPTADIAVVYMKKNGTVAAPVALGVIGGFLALIGSAFAAYATDSGALGSVIIIGGTAGGAAAGAYAGREIAKKTITITVTPQH